MGKVIDLVDKLKPTVNTPNFDDIKARKKELSNEAKHEAIQKKLDALVSKFQKTLKQHKKKLKKRNQKLTDSAGNIAILESMLQMTLSILPVAEKQYLLWKNERAAYAIVALTTQAKDLSNDIQRLGGAGSAAPVLINTIIMPNFQHLLQNTLNEGSSLIKILKSQLPKKEHKLAQESVNTFIKNQTQYMSQVSQAMVDKVEKYFDER